MRELLMIIAVDARRNISRIAYGPHCLRVGGPIDPDVRVGSNTLVCRHLFAAMADVS
jgi:hypothetical protein